MLRNLLKLLTHSDHAATIASAVNDDDPSGSDKEVHLDDSELANDSPMIAGKIGAGGIVDLSDSPVLPANHRAWLLSKDLTHIKICSPKRCEKLARFGVVTAGDLAKVDAEHLVSQMKARPPAVRSIKRYSAAIRLAASVPGMMPRDAQMLIRIHRHSVRAIALDTPSVLYQDLQRYAHSTRGQRLVRGRRLPSLRKVKNWVKICQSQSRNNGQQTIRAAA